MTKADHTPTADGSGGSGAQYCDIARHDTIPKVVRHNARNFAGDVAMREKEFGIWVEYTWADYHTRVKELALGMKALGFKRGDVVAFQGQSRPELVWTEVAGQALGGVAMGIYQDSIGDEVSYLLTCAEAGIVVAEDEEQADKLLELGDKIPAVRKIIYTDTRGMQKYADPRLIAIEDVYAMGRELDAQDPDLYDREVDLGGPEDVSVLCATSGTTAKPKLAMLMNGAFMRHAVAYMARDPHLPGDDYVAVLPLPWIMEQSYVVMMAPIARMIVNFAEAPETMMHDLREIGPKFLLLAPRSWEAIAADVRARMMDAGALNRWIFDQGMRLGLQAIDRGRRSRLASRLLFDALRDRLGFTYLKSAATGGAALGPDTFKFFQAMGVPLRQLYGQTECGGAYTVHDWHEVDFDTVGVPFDDTRVRIEDADESGVGEIVTATGGMFKGYFKDDAETARSLRDGWMYTGDAGYFDGKGHLVVIDRVGDIAVTSKGDKFSPQFIENKLKFSPFIAEAVILGDQKPYLAAILCIRFDIVAKWAEARGLAFTNYTNLSAQARVYGLIADEAAKVNRTLPAAHRIRKFILLYKELDADDGELTRTRKVRRGVIGEKYADIIEAVYTEGDLVHVDTEIAFQDGTRSRIVTDLQIMRLEDEPAAAGPARAAA